MNDKFKFHLKLILLLGFVAVLLTKCATTKDGFTKRVYHNTTAKFNGFFNAKEAKKTAISKLVESTQDDYDSILVLFHYPSEENVNTIREDMERVIEKTQLVIERHEMKVPKSKKRDFKKPEMNKWINDNWLLMGQAYFYEKNYWKAEEVFLYVKRKYEDDDIAVLSRLWLARNYFEKGEQRNAAEMLEEISYIKTKDFPEELRVEYNLVQADLAIKLKDYTQAITKLENAVTLMKRKKMKARPTFILAQLYQRVGKSAESLAAYKQVLKLKPTYEMSFYAQINQAMAFSRRAGDSKEIKDKLLKMLKDEKNKEYFDQIYFALAELEIEERKTSEGISLLNKSLAVNEGNDKQKAKSFLKLADIYFDERIYESAQAYYDSTNTLIAETHPRFKDISNKAKSLNELVSYIRVYEREDSLLQLAVMAEDELTKLIEGVMKEDARKREEERQRLLAALESGGDISNIGDFWAWNPTLREKGKENFIEAWGERPLEDNWRRSKKITFTDFDNSENPDIEETQTAPTDQGRSFEEYLADVPKGQAEIDESIEKRAEARYNAGLIYKEKLDDFENAVEQFEVLVTETPASQFHSVTHYQLYRTYLSKEQGGYSNPFCGTCNSAYWANQTLENYPESEYAVLINNPEFLSMKELKEAEELKAYESIFDKYRKNRYNDVIQESSLVINNEQENHLLAKYFLIKALSIGEMASQFGGQADPYIEALENTVKKFPTTEEGKTAQRYLDILNGEVKVEKEKPKEPELYKYRKGTGHYFVLLVPLEGGNPNPVQSDIANFNSTFFKSSGLSVKSRVLGREYQMLYVREFKTELEAMNYFNAFNVNQNILGDVNKANYYKFVISKSNYSALTKDRDPEKYLTFFEANYLE